MRSLLSLFLSMFCLLSYSQTQEVRVTLKSGVVLKGVVKEFVVEDHITLVIGGMESLVKMSNVSSVENVGKRDEAPSQKSTNSITNSNKLIYGEYEITDKSVLPDSINVEIEGQQITLLLVRGGNFNMGYDGDGSWKLDSEPVHKVTLPSYYISKQFINYSVASKLIGVKVKEKQILQPFDAQKWEDANKLVTAIAEKTGKAYRLLTEAEWEFSAIVEKLFSVSSNEKCYSEWCSDYWGEYQPYYQDNPQGPVSGKRHVARSLNLGRNQWARNIHPYNYNIFVRIAISADIISK